MHVSGFIEDGKPLKSLKHFSAFVILKTPNMILQFLSRWKEFSLWIIHNFSLFFQSKLIILCDMELIFGDSFSYCGFISLFLLVILWFKTCNLETTTEGCIFFLLILCLDSRNSYLLL